MGISYVMILPFSCFVGCLYTVFFMYMFLIHARYVDDIGSKILCSL